MAATFEWSACNLVLVAPQQEAARKQLQWRVSFTVTSWSKSVSRPPKTGAKTRNTLFAGTEAVRKASKVWQWDSVLQARHQTITGHRQVQVAPKTKAEVIKWCHDARFGGLCPAKRMGNRVDSAANEKPSAPIAMTVYRALALENWIPSAIRVLADCQDPQHHGETSTPRRAQGIASLPSESPVLAHRNRCLHVLRSVPR